MSAPADDGQVPAITGRRHRRRRTGASAPARRSHRFRIGVLLMALAGLATACGSGGAAAAPDTVGIVLTQEPRSMGSWTAYSQEGAPWIFNIEESLVTRDGATNQLVGLLATDWRQKDDRTWQFDLRQGVSFQDGTPFDATAAATALNYSWSEKNNFGVRQFMGPQITAKAASTYVLDVTTASPDPILPARLYFSPIFSPKVLTDGTYESTPVGTGPYTFEQWQRGQYLDLTLNPSWWGNKAGSGQQQATVQKVHFTFNPESAVRSASVQANEADVALFVEQNQCVPACATSTSVQTVFLRLDAATNPALRDIRVRQAISMGIDTQALVKNFMPEGAQAAQLVASGATGFVPGLKPYPYNPDEAKRLLAAAAADGVPTTVHLTVMGRQAYVPLGDQIVQAIQAQLSAIGLTADSQMQENSLLQSGLRQKPAPADRGWLLLYMHGNQLGDLSGTTATYYLCNGSASAMCDPQVDQMNKSALTTSGDQRQAAYAQIAQRVYDQYDTIPIGSPADFYAISPHLQWKPRRDQLVLVNTMRLTQG